MKIKPLKAIRTGGKSTKEYVEACKPDLQVRLKSITKKEGFVIDEAFANRIRRKVRSRKKEEIIDSLLCAQIIAQFLVEFEEK